MPEEILDGDKTMNKNAKKSNLQNLSKEWDDEEEEEEITDSAPKQSSAEEQIIQAESIAEPAPDPIAEPAPDPIAEPAPDPIAEPAPDPIAEQPVPETLAEPQEQQIIGKVYQIKNPGLQKATTLKI